MKLSHQLLLLLLVTTSIQSPCQEGNPPSATLLSARQNFRTKLLSRTTEKDPVEVAPRKLFLTVKYPTTNGQLAAYLKGADHFATLAPINEFIARQILKDTGAECSIALSADEVNRHFAAARTAKP